MSHVEFTVNDENVCSSNMRRYLCGNNDDGIPEEDPDDEEEINAGEEEGEEEGADERENRRTANQSKTRDSLKALQLIRNIRSRHREHNS